MNYNLIPDTDRGHLAEAAGNIYFYTTYLCEPFNIYKPRMFMDGNMWCALYGDNLQDGVAGFGSSPAKAVEDFNKNWNKDIE
jgi:hypothetical protein